ncbi:MAG: glycosyltransferase family 2 protein [Proteobacteria bacterium]|nr:glycosyltransferase family 2 protein [Pseudomonadota bacterium]
MKYSIVIPVFNSQDVVGATIDRTVEFFRNEGLDFEIILINDGSPDQSWEVILQKAQEYPKVIAVDLLHNYGQHVANLCGFFQATGDYVITMDDDLQNPPKEIRKLIDKAAEGYDLVIGRFKEKKHSLVRRLGSRVVGFINRKIFNAPKDLVLSNFRIIRKDVVQRVCAYKASYPYIPGLVVMFSSHRANVLVEHNKREVGQSNYNIWRIAKLVSEILFNYSSYPLRLVAGIGLVTALISFTLSVFYLVVDVVVGINVPGWTTVIVLLSFFNGMTLFVLGMVGEYLVRLINQTSRTDLYHVKEVVRGS